MKAQIVRLYRKGGSANPRPRLQFGGVALRDSGFVPGALVQALPVQGGVNFVLCDDLRGFYYSELVAIVKEQSGKLLQVSVNHDRGHEYPCIHTEDLLLRDGGLEPGDTAAVILSPGLAQVRKFHLPPDTKLIHTTSAGVPNKEYRIPAVAFNGKWLEGLGFEQGGLALIESMQGILSFRIEPGKNYKELNSFARRTGSRLIAIPKAHRYDIPAVPQLSVSGELVSRAGFSPGDILTAECSHGFIKLQKLVVPESLIT